MASPILHIKDSYFFEVPKALWHSDYKTKEDVEPFLREAHPHATLDDFSNAMDGKILIPQPFGKLTDLHTKKSGFCISKFMVLETVVAIILFALFAFIAMRLRGAKAPRGRIVNAFEAILIYLRDQVARPAIGEKDTGRFLPILYTMFFFILGCNLIGMLPWLGTPTGAFATTLTMAGVTFLVGFIAGVKKFGIAGYWTNMVPHMELPGYMFPLKIGIFVIEVVGLVIKHAVLGIRLLANMMAGHLVLHSILGMVAMAATAGVYVWGIASVGVVVGSTLFNILELLVAFLQAYIFTFLSALFISAAIHHH
ncbi:ATP synthase F0 sector subunit a [hydrothermal vent metagenome]|uniref:ATP synthase F0 sector subunit a n=1 Tax=hydrothermal vent metagenome TaxID=652676 RepID=A0A3B1CZC5_9ZZZZ